MKKFFLAFVFALVVALVWASEDSVDVLEDVDEAEQYTDSKWGICWGGPQLYGDGFCDCGCSPPTRDIDCDVYGSNPPRQDFRYGPACPQQTGNRNIWCNDIGICEPCDDCGVWTCDPSNYDANDGCHCNCGMPDPDCNTDQFNAYNCFPGLQGVGKEVCDVTGTCTTCGNGVIESGETCDRKSGCCSDDCSTPLQNGIDCHSGDGFCSSGLCLIPTPVDDIKSAKDAQGNVIRTNTTIKVEWVLEDEVNPQVDTFCIEKNKKVGGEWQGWEDAHPNVVGTKRSKNVQNLEPGTTYKFRIRTKLPPKQSGWEATFGISTLSN